MHLTGLKLRKQFESSTTSGLSANDFYQKCLEHKLSPADFDFADDGTTHMKLDILPKIICKNLGAKFIGDYNSAKPRLYTEKIVGNVHTCMGFIFGCRLAKHVPNTLIHEDARKLTSNSAQVIAVYRKEFYADKYTELTYKSRNVEWTSVKFPEHFEYLAILDNEKSFAR